MTFDPSVGWSLILGVLVTAAGVIGTWVTFKSNLAEAGRRIVELEGDQKDVRKVVDELSKRVDRECVDKSDLEKVEGRLAELFKLMIDALGARLGTAEHQLKNIDQKLDARITTLLGVRGRSQE